MDLIDYYIQEEKDHIPLLLVFLENKSSLERGEFLSNLFNFKVDFRKSIVRVEDDAGLFSSCKKDGVLSMSIIEFKRRLSDV